MHAHFHFDCGLYPESGFHPDSGLSQGGTDCFLHPDSGLRPDSGLHPDSGSSLSGSSQQHSPNFNFHVIFTSTCSAVRVNI